MRLLFMTDVHGNTDSYRAASHMVCLRRLDAFVLGGDLFPTGRETPDSHAAYVRDILLPALDDLRTTRRFAVAGNHDTLPALALLRDAGFELLHERVYRLTDRLWIAGYPWVPITPFAVKDWEKFDHAGDPEGPARFYLTTSDGSRRIGDYEADIRPRGTIAQAMDRLAIDTSPARTIYVTHSPPAQTTLDLTYRREHVGSRAIRRFIEVHQPSLTLHGHIHESPAVSGQVLDRIGKTICLNPGGSIDRLQALVLDVEHPEDSLEVIT